MQPIDCLTENDKQIIYQWCTNYANAEPLSIEQILSHWNKNKRSLFRAFGKQLEIKIPVKQEVDSYYRYGKWQELYTPVCIYFAHDLEHFKADPRNHVFINDLCLWFQENIKVFEFETIKEILEYTKYYYLEEGKTCCDKTFDPVEGDKALKIPAGTKIMRAIRKVLEYYHYPNMNLFDRWRDDISVINSDRKIEGELVFSINPVDFITMSDNACGWSSCMSWIDNGGYSTGTIEMLNSNIAIVVYLKSSKPFIYNDLNIPNKAWRTLAFVHKDILLVGKHYPYQSETLAKMLLTYLQEIVKKNVGWKYQYKNQLYLDMIYSFNNDYIHYYFKRLTGKHKIYTYMNRMYHDIIEDHDTEYWCCRNYVKKTLYLNLSGPATCMCCGKVMSGKFSALNQKYCDDCHEMYSCNICNHISINNNEEMIKAITKDDFGHRYIMKGHLNCFLNDYVWDEKGEVVVSKSAAKWSKAGLFRRLTRGRLMHLNEICHSLSDRDRVF